ncbi:MAG: hypothetical protein HY340_03845 [Candidatus Kerfeldbacteria bacterium]|nr:hypothetical protein [Candidatus Kerfeldbacteria bacterium]
MSFLLYVEINSPLMKHRFLFLFLLIALLLPMLAFAEELPNPLGDTKTLEGLIIRVSTGLIGLVAVAAIFMFIYGGIMMLTSGGNEQRVTQGKEILRWTILGLIFIFLAGVILRFVYQTFGGQNLNDISGSIGLGEGNPSATAVRILNAVIGLLGLVGVTMVIWGGYEWLTAAGNEQRVDRAKRLLTAAVVGLIIILLAWAIVRFVILTGVNVTGTPR